MRRAGQRVAAAAGLALLLGAKDPAAPVEIHPAGPTIPENLLRIELRFARPQPMPLDGRRLSLLDAQGRAMDGALLDLMLPSADGRRLTVLMDPGRVKRGVGPNLDAGRALHPGDTVRLRVDGFGGREPVVIKSWRVTAARTAPLKVDQWQLSAPRAGSREPLVVDLRDPISSTGEALIAVRDAAGQRVEGRTSLGRGDAQWRFTPTRPWRREAHALVMHPDLEDPAGNRSCAAFEEMHGSEIRCEAGVERAFQVR